MTYIICNCLTIALLLHREISLRHNRVMRAVVAKLQPGDHYGEIQDRSGVHCQRTV